MKKYVVIYSRGSYDSRVDGPFGIYDSKEAAEAFIESEKSWKRNIKENAIRDLDVWEPNYSEDNSNYYSDLYGEYLEWTWNKIIGDKKKDELTDEDYQKFDDISEEEWFPKFMKGKGYSDEVIKATILYNDSEYSRYNTFYYIREVPYYPGT